MSDIILLSLMLGIIQGLTEFLPISSSAHLLIPTLLFGANDLGLEFDIAVHAGTLCAVIYFFKDDLKVYISSIFNSSIIHQNDRRVAINLLIATVPIVLAGIFLNDLISQRLVTKELIAWSNIVFASLLLLSFYLSKKEQRYISFIYINEPFYRLCSNPCINPRSLKVRSCNHGLFIFRIKLKRFLKICISFVYSNYFGRIGIYDWRFNFSQFEYF